MKKISPLNQQFFSYMFFWRMIRYFITREQDFIQMVPDEYAHYGAAHVYATLS